MAFPTICFPSSPRWLLDDRDKLRVFGQDYPTPDGTGIRDYLHVMDLAEAHGVTLTHLLNQESPTQLTLNIGTGTGLSVLDVIQGFEKPRASAFPTRWSPDGPVMCRGCRPVPVGAAVLGWRARRGLEDMCRDGWAWQQANPMGYRSAP